MADLKYLDLHGERVAYVDEGRGEVIVLLHGMAGSSQTWRPVIRQLSHKYRVVAPDLLGHGDSTKPRSDYSLGAFSVLLRDLLDELAVRDLPVMVVWGECDAIIPVRHAYAAQAARPDIRLEILADVGHFPQAERPAEVVELIEDFIAADPRSAEPVSVADDARN